MLNNGSFFKLFKLSDLFNNRNSGLINDGEGDTCPYIG